MDEQDRYARARRRVKKIRDFYEHLVLYIAVNLILFGINMLFSPDSLWFYWVTFFWGIGVVLHGFGVYVEGRIFGRDWEEKKIREFLEREERR
ncbi:2TM domain-containing protein [Methanoculleus sp. FWC-SCC3]|uniref:2TM domain-containing protein n=1 Tax=Methanoculleus methanifontis TaxID=2584086 RepID=A0ABT8LY81_9EURY|nr:2TM domain-containing protein [Methanoculleus sp. FWC-SCC3]MDN7011739.1 2TM domain-containing protein [Methanoculleus sp. FWC-SCC3]